MFDGASQAWLGLAWLLQVVAADNQSIERLPIQRAMALQRLVHVLGLFSVDGLPRGQKMAWSVAGL
jgi:hypothetical protein